MIVPLLALLLFQQTEDKAPEPVVGRGLLCLKYSSFALLPGERVTSSAGSVETLHLELEGPSGRYWIHESEILAPPAISARRLVKARSDGRVYSVGRDRYMFRGNVPYSIYGKATGEPKDQFIASIGGDALRREPQAHATLSRFRLGLPLNTENCTMRYQYGWDYLFPAET